MEALELQIILFVATTISNSILFGCLFFLLYKVLKNKIITNENNREIHEHDKEILEIKEKMEKCQKV